MKSSGTTNTYVGELEAAARWNFPRYVRELEGMAAGAEASFAQLFLWNCRGDLRFPDNHSDSSINGCTTVFIPATASEPAIIGHNEDGAAEFHGNCLWISVIPDKGYAFDSFVYPGMLAGHAFGVNTAGLVQTINNIRVLDLKPGIPRHFITRAILDCRNLTAALALLQRTDRASGFHHGLGQVGEHNLLSVEAPASGYDVREIQQPFAHANHLLAEAFKGCKQTVTDSSAYRQQWADTLIEGGILSNRCPENILFHRESPRAAIYRCDDSGDDYSRTLATGVFRIYRDRVDWCVHDGPQRRDVMRCSLYVDDNQ